METSDVAVGQSEPVPPGGTMAAAADAVVEELMAMDDSQVANEPPAGTALKSETKEELGPGGSLDLGLENDENFMPEGTPADHNYPVRINMDKIRRLQSSLPVDDPLAPLGSTKNPIRIIQQGNQFITTQDLTDDQLKQILQVLRNQALIEDGTEALASATNTVYNPETSTRIIFRVTNATRALARAQIEEAGMNIPDYKARARKRNRYDGDSSDPDFDPGVPDEELGPLEPRRKARAVRPVRPPQHLVKDYKHIRLAELNNEVGEEESDGGYSDFDPRATAEDRNDTDWMPEGDTETDADVTQSPEWPCNLCGQVFHTKGGLSRHQYMKHGMRAKKPKIDFAGRKAREMLPLTLKRRNKLKQALMSATDEDLFEVVLPQLVKRVSSWDYLLSRSEQGSPGLPSITKLLADYMNLHDVFRGFVAEHMQACNISEEPEVPEDAEQPVYVKIDNEEHSQLLHLPCGEYRVKTNLSEPFLPAHYKNIQTMLELQRERQRKAAWLFDQEQQQQQEPEPEQPQAEDVQNPQNEVAVGIEVLGPESLSALAAGPVLITDDDLSSGRYLAVLNENGEATDLVLHATSSLLYHRPTGQQVLLLEDGSAAAVVAADETPTAGVESNTVAMETLAFESNLGETIEAKAASPVSPEKEAAELAPLDLEPEADRAEQEQEEQQQQQEEVRLEEMMEEEEEAEPEPVKVETPPEEVRRKATEGRRKKGKVKKAAELKFEDKQDHTITQRSAPPPPDGLGAIGEEPTTVDVTQLFPGVNVTDIDENTMLIDRGDGRKIQVDHGGHGVTLETFQNLLTLP